MDDLRHAKLIAAGADFSRAVHAEAAAAKITVDELVAAGIRRGAPTAEASAAAARVHHAFPLAFRKLLDWPDTCVFCRRGVKGLVSCLGLGCGAFGCTSCVPKEGRKCPGCLDRETLKAAQVEATRARLALAAPEVS